VDVWELYDLNNDPNELSNLIKEESHQLLISDLKQELYNLKKEYGNNLSLDELRKISNTNFGGLESHKKNKNH
jgi:hypothetical protein